MVGMSSIVELLIAVPLFAQAGGGDKFALSWGLVLFLIIGGTSIALLPARRTTEFRRPKDD